MTATNYREALAVRTSNFLPTFITFIFFSTGSTPSATETAGDSPTTTSVADVEHEATSASHAARTRTDEATSSRTTSSTDHEGSCYARSCCTGEMTNI